MEVWRAPDLILEEQEVLPGGGNDQDKSVKEVVQVSLKVQSWTSTTNAHSDQIQLSSQSPCFIILLNYTLELPIPVLVMTDSSLGSACVPYSSPWSIA